MVIEWQQGLVTGNEEIDRQHKEMFRRFNNFQSAFNQGKARKELYDLLTFLNDYVSSHFAMEEELQVQHCYPVYMSHKEEHDDFIRKLRKMEERLDTIGATATQVILTNMALAVWLTKHISGSDREFAAFLPCQPTTTHTAMTEGRE